MAKKEQKTTKVSKEKNKNKKSFFKDFKAELKKVVWPTPKQLVNNTVAVITIVLITAVIVFVLDVAFESMNKYGVDKLKNVISNTSAENSTDSNSTTDENVTDENTASDESTQTDENTTTEDNETSEENAVTDETAPEDENQNAEETNNETSENTENNTEETNTEAVNE